MTKLFFTIITTFLALSLFVTASAHTGMSQQSTLHVALHIALSVSLYLFIIASGYFLFKYLPKAIKQRVKK